MRNEGNRLLLSAASLWEIALKVRSGKLRLPETGQFVKEHLGRLGIVGILAVDAAHVFRVLELPDHHRDPFDRLLVAQCQVENVPLVTSDPMIPEYAIDVIWYRNISLNPAVGNSARRPDGKSDLDQIQGSPHG